MPKPLRLGILVPSTNTALEPLTQSLFSSIPHTAIKHRSLTVHFSRFPVTIISLSTSANAQFQSAPIIAAAKLLADAEVDIIGWSGTSAGWLGFEVDKKLCAEIEAATGIPATTSVLALNKALVLHRVSKMALVTPYQDDVQEAIIKNYANVGIEITPERERHLGIVKNTEIGRIGEEVLDGMVADVVGRGADVVATFCTNLRAATRVQVWEEMYGVMVLDTVTLVVWDMLRICGVEVHEKHGWGKLFRSLNEHEGIFQGLIT
jgi:maleate isomerase